MKKWYTILWLTLLSSAVSAQEAGWLRTFGGIGGQVTVALHVQENGELLILAEDTPDPASYYNFLRWYRVSPSGQLLGEKMMFGFGNTYPKAMLAISDDRFLIVGGSAVGSETDFKQFLTEIDASGERRWQKRYPHPGLDPRRPPNGYFLSIDPLPQGDLFLAGVSVNILPPKRWLDLMRVDDRGNVVWHRVDSTSLRFNYHVRSTTDVAGNCYVLTSGTPGIGGEWTSYISKWTASGNKLWQKQLTVPSPSLWVEDMIVNRDGDLVMVGATAKDQFGQAPFVMKYSPLKDEFAVHLPEVPNWSYGKLSSVRQTADGGYLLGGALRNVPTTGFHRVDLWVLKLHAGFGIEWSTEMGIGGNEYEEITGAVTAGEWGIFAAGYHLNYGSAVDNEILALRVNTAGDTLASACDFAARRAVAYPNPAGDFALIGLEENGDCPVSAADWEISVYDPLGRRKSVPHLVVNGKFRLDLGGLASAVYFISLKNEEGIKKTIRLLHLR
ncbi:MAG: T9SS type A sorting domain-containing protein [Bacteroidota bacterium]